jgi:N-acetylglucosaminyl-diphospho-decaprenol L-rhamnosyltransferase
MAEAAAAHDIDVVIPTWNRFDLLERCLNALAGQTVGHTAIVVDNGSSDGTPELIRERFPATRVVVLPENAGFARAVNRGLAAGTAPYVVLVNNDVEPAPDFLERIVAPLRADAAVGAVAGVLLTSRPDVVDSYGVELDDTLAAFARFAGAPYEPSSLHERHLAAPSGGAAAYRRTALQEVGGFDQNLFAYMEDVDLALRLRSAGWRVAGAPGAAGVHLGSASFGVRSRFQMETAGASRAYMLRKYGVLSSRPGAALRALAMEMAVVLADAVTARSLAAVRGRVRGWRAAHSAERAQVPEAAINPGLGFREALRRRAAVLRAG